MNILDIIIIGIGLSMDAFAVSICKGMTIFKNKNKKALIIALCFGLFQAVMPIVGYFVGNKFHNFIVSIDHWIAFFLLLFIGINMIKNAILNESTYDDKIDLKTLLSLGVSTSIDALIIGITLSCLSLDIFVSSIIIGFITFILSFVGVIIGNRVGEKLGVKSQIFGGFILIVIGMKILFEHLHLI